MLKNLTFLLFFLVFFFSCSQFNNPSLDNKEPPLFLFKEKEKFLTFYQQLKNPKGVLPNTPFFTSLLGELCFEDPLNFFSFFVFDASTTLILFSVEPFYALKIQSFDFAFHLDEVFKEIQKGFKGAYRRLSTLSFYGRAGENQVGFYFTPKEFYPLTSGNNKYRWGSAGGANPHPWVWLDAANTLIASSPSWDEEQLTQDFFLNPLKKTQIFAKTSSLIPAPHKTLPYTLPFSIVIGKNLDFTPTLKKALDSFWTQEKLTQDFILFFSLPLGNAKSYTPLREKDGIVIDIKGKVSQIHAFLKQEGLFLDSFYKTYAWSVALEKNKIVLSSQGFLGPVSFCAEPYNNPNFCLASENFQATGEILEQNQTLSFTPTGLSGRGFVYWICVQDECQKILWPEIPKKQDDLLLTEIMWAGSTSNFGESTTGDDWFEIKNTTNKILTLKGLLFRRDDKYWSIPVDRILSPQSYFVFANTKNKVFSQNLIDNLYSDSDISLPASGNYCLTIENENKVILDQVCDIPLIGSYLRGQYSYSRVRNTAKEWAQSSYPFEDFEDYHEKTFGTPGYAKEDEF